MSVDERKFTFTWKIENYSLCYLKTGEKIDSPIFTAESLGGSKWCLRLYPSGKDNECSKFISCSLYRDDDLYHESIHVNWKIDIACSDGIVVSFVSSTPESRIFLKNRGFTTRTFTLIKKITEKMKNISDKTLIVRCHLRTSDTVFMPASECEARTKIAARKGLHELNLQLSNENSYSGQKKIKFHDNSEYEINCSVSFEKTAINIIKIQEDSKNPRLVECKVSLVKKKGKEIISRSDTHLFDTSTTNNSWEFPAFITEEHLLGINKNDGLMSEECMLLFDICASDGIKFDTISYTSSETSSNVDICRTLRKDLQDMLLKGQDSDVQLRVQGELFKVHKCILGARSPVLHSMLQQDILVSKARIVDVTDIEPSIMRLLLKFLYSGLISEMNDDTAMKLLIVSNKYQIQSLLEKCVSFLKLNLTVENACNVFKISDMVNHKFLKSIALDYIALNMTQIMRSLPWMQWIKENSDLANEIYKHLAQNFDIKPKKVPAN